MSLVDAILKNRPAEVEQLLNAGADINEIDNYGYTPLIEAAIANNLEIATLLIRHGAKIDEPDFVGGTALQWSVENHNLELTKLLLDKGADPNAYTSYGQPVLVKPLLRQQPELKQLLYKYGSDVKFAQDYINTKLLGHRFELRGRIDIVDTKGKFIEIDLEGFILEFTLNVIVESLARFRNNFAARSMRTYFDELAWIIRAFSVAAQLLRLQQYMIKVEDYQDYINSLLQDELLLIPVGYEGHAITFVKYKNFWAHCDRGARSVETGATVTIYQINNPRALTQEFIKKLLYKKQSKQFITNEIEARLDLMPIASLPLTPQITGNCSWANVEAAMPTILFLLRLVAAKNENNIPAITQQAMYLYNTWHEWDKDRALYDCVQSFAEANPARRAAKAAILGAVLTHRCDYENSKDTVRAEQIIDIFKKYPEYQYVLKGYLKAYNKSPEGIDVNLRSYFDNYGILLKI